MAVVAVAIWGAIQLHTWYFSVALADAVAAFNRSAQSNTVGRLEPPLTEDEVVTSIQRQLPTLKSKSSQVKAIFGQIARVRRLPRSVSLAPTTAYRMAGKSKMVWWIDLSVMTSKDTGYTLRIRRTDNPAAASVTP